MKWSLFLVCVLGLAGCVRSQTCWCFTFDAVNVRDSPCGNVIGSGNSGQCYTNLGGSQQCILSGVMYNFVEFDFGGRSGWAADDYLTGGSNCGGTGPTPAPGEPGVCANIQQVSREEWGARPPNGALSPLNTPVSTVYIHHTVTSQCYTQAACSASVRNIQNYHMDVQGWQDIGYSFLIGDDGRAYEGRGWEWVGTHTCCGDCNTKAIAISMIGNFQPEEGGVYPSDTMMQGIRNLIDCAQQQGYIVNWNSLNILGHRDACSTACPGSAAYSYIQTWAEYGRIPDPCFC